MCDWILVKGSEMQGLLDEYKAIFLGKRENVETSGKPSPYIGVFYKFLLKSVKSVNGIFSMIECW